MLPDVTMPILVLLAVLGLVLLCDRQGVRLPACGPCVVLSRARASDEPKDGIFIEVVGQRKGVLARLLAAFGRETGSRLIVTTTHVSVRHVTLWGSRQMWVPLGRASSTFCRQGRPGGRLVLGILFACVGFRSMMGGAIFGLQRSTPEGAAGVVVFASGVWAGALWALLGAGLVVLYGFSRRTTIGITYGGTTAGLTFRRSVVDGAAVDLERALQIVDALNRHVVGRPPDAEALVSAIGTAPRSTASQSRAEPTQTVTCPQCGAKCDPDSRFCDSCGVRLG